MSVCSIPGVDLFCSAASAATGAVASGFWSSAAQMLASAQAELLKVLFTSWLTFPTPTLSGAGSPVEFIQSRLTGLVAAAAVLGLIAAAIRMMIDYKHEHTAEAFKAIVRTVIIVGAGAAFISLMAAAGDAFSTWIVNQAVGSASAAQTFTTDANLTAVSGIAPGVIFILAPLSMLGILIQIALLLIRSAFLVVLAGLWPLAAAASTTEDGRTWYRRLTGWIVAFLLFKPVAGIIYATAIRMLTGGPSNELDVIEGVILLTMACLALPALLRLVAPMTGRLGGLGTAEVLGAAVGVAAGAAMVIGSGGAGAAAGGGGLAGGAAQGGQGPGGAGLAGGAKGGSSGGGGGAPSGGGSSGGGGTGSANGSGSGTSVGSSGSTTTGAGPANGGGSHKGGGNGSGGAPTVAGGGQPSSPDTASGAPTQPGLSRHALSSLAGAPQRVSERVIGGNDQTPEAAPAPGSLGAAAR